MFTLGFLIKVGSKVLTTKDVDCVDDFCFLAEPIKYISSPYKVELPSNIIIIA
jgi:hypothetical protein